MIRWLSPFVHLPNQSVAENGPDQFLATDNVPTARMCALSVIIGTPSEEGNNRDCGTLVRLNNVDFYELTPRHVVLASPATLGPVNDDMMGSKG